MLYKYNIYSLQPRSLQRLPIHNPMHVRIPHKLIPGRCFAHHKRYVHPVEQHYQVTIHRTTRH